MQFAFFKKPYAAIVILLATLLAVGVMASHPDPAFQKVGFIFATVLIGGFGAQAVLAVGIGALRLAVLMVSAILAMFAAAVFFVDAAVFTAFVLDNTAQVAGGAVLGVLGELLRRSMQPE